MALTMYCPFFSVDYNDKQGKQKIRCERASINFEGKKEFKEYVSQYCGSLRGWKECSIAESTLKHYDGEERV
jgi:hypothetical protein